MITRVIRQNVRATLNILTFLLLCSHSLKTLYTANAIGWDSCIGEGACGYLENEKVDHFACWYDKACSKSKGMLFQYSTLMRLCCLLTATFQIMSITSCFNVSEFCSFTQNIGM